MNEDPTNQIPAGDEPTQEQPGPQKPRRLLRSRSDRMLGGVAGGLAGYFGVDALIFRIGFGVSVFFGGLGALAYLALLLFVPAEEDDGTVGEAPIQRSRGLAIAAAIGAFILLVSWGIFDGDPLWFGGGPWFFGGPLFLIALVAAAFYLLRRDRDEPTSPSGILTTIAIAIGSVIALSVLALVAAWAGATGNGEPIAGVVIAIGVLLVIAAFRGGARWLIVPALALAIPLSAVAAANVSFDGGIGERSHEPVAESALPDDGYELGIGRLMVDLRDLQWRSDSVVELETDLGVGQTVIAVPADVCVTGDLHAGAGLIEVGGGEEDGFDVSTRPVDGTTATPRLVLDSEVDLGHLWVINDDDVDLDDHRDADRLEDETNDAEMRDAMAAACAPDQTDQQEGK